MHYNHWIHYLLPPSHLEFLPYPDTTPFLPPPTPHCQLTTLVDSGLSASLCTQLTAIVLAAALPWPVKYNFSQCHSISTNRTNVQLVGMRHRVRLLNMLLMQPNLGLCHILEYLTDFTGAPPGSAKCFCILDTQNTLDTALWNLYNRPYIIHYHEWHVTSAKKKKVVNAGKIWIFINKFEILVFSPFMSSVWSLIMHFF